MTVPPKPEAADPSKCLSNLRDANDRSNNEPMCLLSPQQVLGLYNQHHTQNEITMTTAVREWICNTAREAGWYCAIFAGNQLLLSTYNLPAYILMTTGALHHTNAGSGLPG